MLITGNTGSLHYSSNGLSTVYLFLATCNYLREWCVLQSLLVTPTATAAMTPPPAADEAKEELSPLNTTI